MTFTTAPMFSHDSDRDYEEVSRSGNGPREPAESCKHDPEVLIVGPFPPPLGGVSSHVERATAALSRAGYKVAVLNHFGTRSTNVSVMGSLHRNPLLYLVKLRRINASVVHYHHAGRPSLLLAAALARRLRVRSHWLITVHNHTLERHLAGGLLAPLIRWTLSRFDQIVAVSPEIAQSLIDCHVDTTTVVLPAYIPAQTPAVDDPDDWVPAAFFEPPSVVLVTSAYRAARFGAGGDLYGLDLAVKTFAALAPNRAELKLAIFLSHPPRGRWAKRHLTSILQSVGAELRTRVGVWVGEQLLPAFRPNVVYLRPTQTDGDAVSVREALNCGVPVVASDCVARPNGVITVPYGDRDTWCERVASALVELGAHPHHVLDTSSLGVTAALSELATGSDRDILKLYEPHLGPSLRVQRRRP